MEMKTIKHGNHALNNDRDGYMYSCNTSRSYSFNSHLHKCYEFIHIIHGQLVYTVEGSEYMLSDGDFIMTNPSEMHSFSFPAECDYEREFLHIYPGFIKNFPEMTFALDSRKMGYFNRFPAEMVRKYEIDKIFRHIKKCCTDITPETDTLILSLTVALICRIKQILRTEIPEHQIVIQSKKTSDVRNYIDEHFNEPICVETVAASFFISQSQLERIFKKETGMTVKTYLTMRRVTHAKNLIMEGRQMITNISSDCGFNDYSSFYRCFVKYVGMSPEEFKNTHNVSSSS